MEASSLELRHAGGVHYMMGISGDPGGALEKLDELNALLAREPRPFEVGRATVGFSFLVWNTFFKGQMLRDLGRFAEAEASLHRAVDLAREHDDVESLGWAYNDLSSLGYFTGEPGDGLSYALRSLELSERLGGSFSRSTTLSYLTLARLARGEAEEARSAAQDALDEIARSGTGLQYETRNLSALAEALLMAGDHDAARRHAADGVAAAERCGTVVFEAGCRSVHGRALVAAGEYEQAQLELESALQTLMERAPGWAPPALEALADLTAARGEVPDERRRLEEARAMYAEQGATGHERRVAERLKASNLPQER